MPVRGDKTTIPHSGECTLPEDHLGQCGWVWHHPQCKLEPAHRDGCTWPGLSPEAEKRARGAVTLKNPLWDDQWQGHGEGCALAPALCDHPTAPSVRTFGTGATRDTEEGKIDYEGFLSPLALERFGQYMDEHRYQKDGSVRDSDNWQKGMPLDVYLKSMLRHVFELWRIHRGHEPVPTDLDGVMVRDKRLEDALCAIQFNAQGYLHATLQAGKE